MKKRYKEKAEKMIQYYGELKKEYWFENDKVRHIIALNYSMEDRELDLTQIEAMKKHIKNKTNIFSPFRGIPMIFALSGLLCATSDTPKNKFDSLLNNEKILRDAGFNHSSYLPIALYALSSFCKEDDISKYANKAMDIYKEMKKKHPVLTSGDDYAFAILLASTDNSRSLLDDYYDALTDRGFYISNGLQMLSHILVLSNKHIRDVVNHCEYIYNKLKDNNFKVAADYYPAIGLVCLLDIEKNVLATDLIDVASYLRSQKKYKWLENGMLVLLASAIIASEHTREKSDDVVIRTTLNDTIQAIIVAQQVAILGGAIGASVAATIF